MSAAPVFCTYFDAAFLSRGLALHASLRRHCPGARLWTLCLDEQCRAALERLRLPGISLLGLGDVEAFAPELRTVKGARSPLEYALTCTPVLPALVLEREPAAERVTYLDADLYFFSSPAPLFEEMGEAPLAITPHRYPPAFRHWEARTGVFNDAWVSFRRGPESAACLRRWRAQCLEWCYNRSEDGRFGEQQYLDEWPRLYPGTAVLRHPGANLGPWNLGGTAVRLEAGRPLADGRPLVFFHFSGVKRVAPGLFDLNLADFGVRPGRAVLDGIFAPYLRELAGLEGSGLRAAGRKDHGASRAPWAQRARRAARGLAHGDWVLFAGGRVL
jgi:hypothetical protein